MLFNFGTSRTVVPSPTTPRAALSFHVYASTSRRRSRRRRVRKPRRRHAERTAARDRVRRDTDPATITRIASTIEDGLISWAFWSYDENLVIDKGKPPTPDNVRATRARRARPSVRRAHQRHPDGVALRRGNRRPAVLVHGRAEPGRRHRSLSSAPAPTPHGYRVTVTGGKAVGQPCASSLRIKNGQARDDRHRPRHPLVGNASGLTPVRLNPGARAQGDNEKWWAVEDSNLRPHACRACALTN